MNFASYGAETVYNLEELVKSVQHLCIRIDFMAEKLCDFLDMEREMLEMQKETRDMQREMHWMQSEMFEDYKKVKDCAHVKLQGDTEGNHATAYTA